MISLKPLASLVVLLPFLAAAVSCNAQSEADDQPSTTVGETTTEPALAPGAAPSADWPNFRGPSGMGASASELPVEWSETENIAWKTPLPGAGASSPIVLGDHIYLTSFTGYLVPGEDRGSLDQLTRHLICLNREGKILWDTPVKAKLPEEDQIRDHGYAANTPAADADRIYAFFGKTGVFAFDHDGNRLWQADVGSNTSGWGSAASPLLYEDLVIVNASVESESLVALDRKSGEEKWRAGGINESWNTPVIVQTADGADELVVAKHGKVLGFDPKSGDQLWSCDTDITWYMVPCAVASKGIVYVLGGRSGVAALAVKAGGRGDVTETHRLWTSQKGSNVTSPVFLNDHLYWMHEKLGIAYCAHGESGEIKYEERVNRAGQIYGSALLAGDRIYYLNRSGQTFVVAASPQFELLASNDLGRGGSFDSSPAVMGDQLLIRSDEFLYCIGK